MLGLIFSPNNKLLSSGSQGLYMLCVSLLHFGWALTSPNVRFVVHHSIPKDLESFAKESGRTGRDGCDAHSYIFFRFKDRAKHLRNISSLPHSDHKLLSLHGLNEMVKYYITPAWRRQQITTYFHKDSAINYDKSCAICSSMSLEHPKDLSNDANEVLNCLHTMQLTQPKVTMKALALTFRGSKSSSITFKGFQNVNGSGKGQDKGHV